MSTNVSRISIVELADLLEDGKKNNQKMALILGSRAGALARGQKLIEEMAPYSTPSLATMKETEQFSECYSLLKVAKKRIGGEDVGVLLKQLKDIDFSMADDFMADLVKQKIFRVIINSNIDDILYDAFIGSGLKKNDDFVYFDISHYITTGSVDEIVHHSKSNKRPCKIVNLYNDVDMFVYSLDKPGMQADIGRHIKRLLNEMKIDSVLVVGMDLAWDQIILSALPSRIKTVLFVNEDEDEQVKKVFCSTYERLEQFSFISGRQWRYEKVLRALYFQINPGALPHRHEFTIQLQDQLDVMQRNLTSVKDVLTNLDDRVERTQRQIMELSRIVKDAIKHNADEEA